jgi:hypothetical protein
MGTASHASAQQQAVAWSRRHTQVFAASLLALASLPWTVRYWPSQDGPNHLAIAHVIASYADPGSPFPQYLSVKHGFRPSAALDVIFSYASRFTSLETAEKWAVSATIVLLPLSLLVLARRVIPRRAPNVFLALPFVVGWPLVIGFLSFEIALALGVFVLALAWEAPSEPHAPGSSWRTTLASVLYFLSVWFHPAAAFLTGLVFLLLEWRNVLRWREWPRMLAIAGPGAMFVVGTYLTAHSSEPLAVEGQTFFSDPLSVLGAAFEYNIGFTPLELGPRIAALSLLLPCTYRAVRANPLLGSSREAAVGRIVVALLAAYFVAPGTWAGWAYAAARFLVYGQLLLPLAAEVWPSVARRLLVVGPALAGVTMAIQWPFIHGASARTQDVIEVGASLPHGAKLIPADFNASVLGPQTNGDSWAHLVVSRDAVASQLFAAGRPRMGGERFRMVSFNPGVLDVEAGALPWSDFEMWNDIGRACAPHGAPQNWFVHWDGDCGRHLADRKGKLEKVVDRYDYLLMLDPPGCCQDLLPSKLRLVSHVGSAWLYAIVHDAGPAIPTVELRPHSGAS